jgi:hypothetical protein
VLLTASCGGGGGGGGTGTGASGGGEAAAGGAYRVGWENSFGFTNSFDPTREYLGEAFSIYSNLLIRTLAGYNYVAGTNVQNVPSVDADLDRCSRLIGNERTSCYGDLDRKLMTDPVP